MLLLRYAQGELSPAERAEVEAWLAEASAHREEFEQLQLLWAQAPEAGKFAQIDAESDWAALRPRLEEKGWTPAPAKVRSLRPYRWLAAVAAVAVLLLLVRLAWPPASPDWQLAENGPGQAPKAVTLPDGSQVYLNQNSRLRYPAAFAAESRQLALSGEALFEVSRPGQPFIVETDYSRTEVLGTVFGLRAYPGEDSVRLQVTEGRVRFSSQTGQATAIFEAGEAGRLDQTGNLGRIAAPDPNALAWQTRRLRFEARPLRQVLPQLARTYQLDLGPMPAEGMDCQLTIVWQDAPLDEVLQDLEELLQLRYTLQGDSLTIIGADCQTP